MSATGGRESGSGGTGIRAITEGELDAWRGALDASFLLAATTKLVPPSSGTCSPEPSLGIFAAGQRAGTLQSIDLEVTLPRRRCRRGGGSHRPRDHSRLAARTAAGARHAHDLPIHGGGQLAAGWKMPRIGP